MPRITTFGAFEIWMYFHDHNPPHVHVVSPDFQAQVRISNGELLAGEMPAKVRGEALAWIGENKVFLMEKWDEFQE